LQLSFHKFTQFSGWHVAGNTEKNDRKGADIKFENGGRLGFNRQLSSCPINSSSHIVGSSFKVGAPFERKTNLTGPLRRSRGHFYDPRRRGQGSFDRDRHQFLNFFRPDTRVAGLDRNGWKRHIRHQVDWQPEKRNRPQQGNDQEHYRDKNRTAYR